MQNGFEAQPYTGKTAFEQWAEYEGVPMIRDFIVPDLNSVALKSWDRVGASGSWLVLTRRDATAQISPDKISLSYPAE
jgi:hypothetical protein